MTDLATTLATLTAMGAVCVPVVQLLVGLTKSVLDQLPARYYPALAVAYGMVVTFALALVAGAQGAELMAAIVAGFLGGLGASQQFRGAKEAAGR